MRFTPQTKRFALVPVEPGNEKDTDVLVKQLETGGLVLSFEDLSFVMVPENTFDAAIIAALGFPITGEDA